MADDLLSGRVTSFRREQGFGVITLDDDRAVKFDASACTMVPNEGDAVRLRIAPARWGGGFKALHVEPAPAAVISAPPRVPVLDQQLAALQGEHLLGSLSEHAMHELAARAFGGQLHDARLIDVIDAFYAADLSAARHDGYLRFAAAPSTAELLAAVTAVAPGLAASGGAQGPMDGAIAHANAALAAAGDARRIYPLATGHAWYACFVLLPDRAERLAAVLPFA